ncbi:MAG: DUF4340 domain-containing protein [Bryobacterales bacterium]|nr:DUF4340 domain-containing protein [Bryobacterales bacterium]
MKANPLVIAVALLALLGGAVWYTRENPPPDEDAAPKIVDVEEDEIRSITLRRAGEEAIEMARGEEGEWEFAGGLAVAADDSSVGLLASSLASLNAERVVSESVVDWSPYELDDPALAVSYRLEEGGGEVRFGRDTPTGTGVFARLEGDTRLFTVYSYNRNSFDKSVFDLRDKRLLKVDEDTVTRIELETASRMLAFERDGGDWRIVQPMEARADDFTVGDLSRAVRTAEMTEILEEDGDSGAHSFDRPVASVRITDGGGTHELVVAKDGDDHFARSSDQAGVYAVSSTLGGSLDKELADFRSRKLFDFGFADPARVEVRAGENTVLIARSDGKWTLESDGGRELEGERVQTLLDRLRNLTATEFPSDRAEDQSRYGLDAPAIEAAVTPEGEDAETESVRVSSTESAAVYAARGGEPTTYKVEQAAAQNIERSVEDILREPEGEEGGADSGEEGEA